MLIETSLGTYRWIEDWIKVPESSKADGRTHGIAVNRAGNIMLFHHGNPGMLVFSPQGELLDSWGDFPGAHGLTLVEEEGVEFLWLVDETTRQVIKTTLQGEVVQSLAAPSHNAYATGEYTPTWVAVNEKRFGGNGDLWLSDGYGSALIHHFDASGRQLQTLDGTEGAGRFKCPHALAVDTRRGEPEIYIADRGNRRFQVYDVEGKFRRTFGADFFNSPNISVPMGEFLLVPELAACLTILDKDDQPVAQIGCNYGINKKPGWPNNREWVVPGKFNSSHMVAVDAPGNIYMVEWIQGGRVTKLEKQG